MYRGDWRPVPSIWHELAHLCLLRAWPHSSSVAHAVEAILDTAIRTDSHALKRQAVVNALDGTLNRDGHALGAALDWTDEVVDVALPVYRKLCQFQIEMVTRTKAQLCFNEPTKKAFVVQVGMEFSYPFLTQNERRTVDTM